MAAAGAANHTRFEDRRIVEQLLQALAQSKTLDDFYSRNVAHATGERGKVAECARRAREVLGTHEQQYVAHIEAFATRIGREIGRDRLNDVTDLDYIKLALAVLLKYELRGSTS